MRNPQSITTYEQRLKQINQNKLKADQTLSKTLLSKQSDIPEILDQSKEEIYMDDYEIQEQIANDEAGRKQGVDEYLAQYHHQQEAINEMIGSAHDDTKPEFKFDSWTKQEPVEVLFEEPSTQANEIAEIPVIFEYTDTDPYL